MLKINQLIIIILNYVQKKIQKYILLCFQNFKHKKLLTSI